MPGPATPLGDPIGERGEKKEHRERGDAGFAGMLKHPYRKNLDPTFNGQKRKKKTLKGEEKTKAGQLLRRVGGKKKRMGLSTVPVTEKKKRKSKKKKRRKSSAGLADIGEEKIKKTNPTTRQSGKEATRLTPSSKMEKKKEISKRGGAYHQTRVPQSCRTECERVPCRHPL